MVHQSLKRRSLLALPAAVAACSVLPTLKFQEAPALANAAPAIPREFRGAWVATVANIDWPSKKGLSAAEQQAEALATLARCQQLGLNAVLLQVRTSADALYRSSLEPWSEYLSGTQGVDPGYDPLAFWLEQAHARGIELHAWFNPYRARQSAAQSALHPNHLSQTQPTWVKSYGKQLWIDPGEPEAAAHTLAVFRDVLSRYDIDGLHIDDYFYPYPEKDAAGNEVDFPDEGSYAKHGDGLSRADWRRRNVDRLVEAMFKLQRELRPSARLGISPFGIMKPDLRPAGIQGFSQYDKLFADVERWLTEGWLDYLVPQLYWPRAQVPQAFGVLLQRWLELNPAKRHIYAGLYTSRINNEATSWLPGEITGQVAMGRELNPNGGHVHFSMAALNQNRKDVSTLLRTESYPSPALPPASAWLNEAAPAAPQLLHVQSIAAVAGFEGWRLEAQGSVRRHWLWWREAGTWRAQTLGPNETFTWPERAELLVASSVNASGIESPRRAWTQAA
jgi:uncharacterized lipoprotein YddW (UPF0748 family)